MDNTAKKIFQKISNEISVYNENEARSIAYLIMENILGLSRQNILLNKTVEHIDEEKIKEIILRVNKSEPIQYILGETFFYNGVFKVNKSVLIPRPETEELVDLIIKENRNLNPLNILDIGTGSGCIAISLKKELKEAHVSAIDISTEALELAKQNAVRNNVEVSFIKADILHEKLERGIFNIIVSNPPYITEKEKTLMQSNVLDYEPSLALFVEDNEPLIFYKKIVEVCKNNLATTGKCYFEINENFGNEVAALLIENNFSEVAIIKDFHGKDRFVKGLKN